MTRRVWPRLDESTWIPEKHLTSRPDSASLTTTRRVGLIYRKKIISKLILQWVSRVLTLKNQFHIYTRRRAVFLQLLSQAFIKFFKFFQNSQAQSKKVSNFFLFYVKSMIIRLSKVEIAWKTRF